MHKEKLPTGFGSIRFIAKNRKNPWGVHEPGKMVDGKWKRGKPICYVSDWYIGFAMLSAWHAGKYEKGLEKHFEKASESEIRRYCEELLETVKEEKKTGKSATLSEVYQAWFELKFGENAAKQLSASSRNAANAAFYKLAPLSGRQMDSLRAEEFQHLVNRLGAGKERDGAGMSYASVRNVVQLIHALYHFGQDWEMCKGRSGLAVVMPWTREPVHHDSFSDEELRELWKRRDEEIPATILVMCFTGFRVSAYADRKLQVNLEEGYMKGGVKTEAGKERLVPIHPCIRPLLEMLLGRKKRLLLGKGPSQFRRDMANCLMALQLRPLSPHSTRHTFNRLLERAGVSEADRKRLLGHSLKNDLLNGTYGHRSLQELRREVEKISVDFLEG